MCLSDVLRELDERGLKTHWWHVRWAVLSGKLERPPKDGAGNFVYGPEVVDKLEQVMRAYKVGRPRTRV